MRFPRTLRVLAVMTTAMFAGYGPAQAQFYGYGPGYGMMPNSGYGPNYGAMMPGYGRGYGPAGMMPGRGRYMLNDVDGDGVVGAEEAASAADEVFSAMDADDNGTLTMDEYMSVRMGPQLGFNPERQAEMQQAKSDRFSSLDSDGDGSVTKQEFLAAAKTHLQAADADGDGKVTPWEFRNRNWN